MKKVGIITIIDNDNYGNRLQNYALQEIIKRYYFEPITILNKMHTNERKYILLRMLKKILKNRKGTVISNKRKANFEKFNTNIIFSKKNYTAYSNYKFFDYLITGSDQVWNPNIGRLKDVDLLNLINAKNKISFSASFGVENISNEKKVKLNKCLQKYKAISVREDAGKKIIQDLIKNIKIEVLIDPTMLLTNKDWDKVSKKPKMLKTNKYILNYFLGDLSEFRKNEINKFAKENNCEVISILDKNSPYYSCGPSEFLYLEKNAFMICTDSFHSSVFAILYNRPFIVFDREQSGIHSMNSRLDTLLTRFKLQNRRFKGKITDDLLKCDYTEAKEILEKEKEKSMNFLKKALDID